MWFCAGFQVTEVPLILHWGFTPPNGLPNSSLGTNVMMSFETSDFKPMVYNTPNLCLINAKFVVSMQFFSNLSFELI